MTAEAQDITPPASFLNFLLSAPLSEKRSLYERTTGYQAGEEKETLYEYLAQVDTSFPGLPRAALHAETVAERLEFAELYGKTMRTWTALAFYHAGFEHEVAAMLAWLRADILCDERTAKAHDELAKLENANRSETEGQERGHRVDPVALDKVDKAKGF